MPKGASEFPEEVVQCLDMSLIDGPQSPVSEPKRVVDRALGCFRARHGGVVLRTDLATVWNLVHCLFGADDEHRFYSGVVLVADIDHDVRNATGGRKHAFLTLAFEKRIANGAGPRRSVLVRPG